MNSSQGLSAGVIQLNVPNDPGADGGGDARLPFVSQGADAAVVNATNKGCV